MKYILALALGLICTHGNPSTVTTVAGKVSPSSGSVLFSTAVVTNSLGVGTTSPIYPIDINSLGNGGNSAQIRLSDNSTQNTLKGWKINTRNYNINEKDVIMLQGISNQFGNEMRYGGTGSTYLSVTTHTFYTNTSTATVNGTVRMSIVASGNVGIGTSAPITLLEVNGDSQFGSGATKSSFTATGFFEPIKKTKAQIDLLVPTRVGQYVDCTDCILPGLCRSTGTAAAQWRKVESAVLGCGTNN